MSARKKTNTFFSRNKFLKIKKTAGRNFRINSKLFLGLAILFFILWTVNFLSKDSLSFSAPINLSEIQASESIIPVKVEIPAIDINLPIEQTVIENMRWEVSKTGVSHLATSGYPTQENNIIFYGHNAYDRLGRLKEVKADSIVRVVTKNNSIYFYKVYESKIVEPNDIKYLTDFSDETLTIYTCIGFADSKRLVVKAKKLI